jgi:hypothetical protein
MKERLGLTTNEELFSKALSHLYQTIHLEDKCYKIGAFTEPGALGDGSLSCTVLFRKEIEKDRLQERAKMFKGSILKT